MAKQSGIGDNFYIGGFDLSGDVASLDKMSGPIDVLDVTAIKQAAHQRLYGLRGGAWSFTTLFESTAGVVTPGFPASGTPVTSTYNFNVMVTITGGTLSNVVINGSSVGTTAGTYTIPPLGTITITYTVAPTWNWFALGAEHQALKTPIPSTDVIATYSRGIALGNPSACMVAKQLNYDPTRDASGMLTLKVDLQANAFGYEWGVSLTPGLRTDTVGTTGAFQDLGTPATTNFGAQAYLQIVDLVGTNVDVQIQHSTTSGGTYTTLIDFGSQTAIGGFRQSVSNVTAVNEFIKVVTSGTFTYVTFFVMFNRNQIAGVVFLWALSSYRLSSMDFPGLVSILQWAQSTTRVTPSTLRLGHTGVQLRVKSMSVMAGCTA